MKTRVKIYRRRAADREFHNIRELLEMLMSEMRPTKHRMHMRPSLGWAPPTDVYETESEFVVTMDIAGMNPDDIGVITDGKLITIRGNRRELAAGGPKQFHKLEIQVGPFQRIIHIPVAVDAETVTKEYRGGLLEIRMKKTAERTSRREIDIE
jgi:HSP20 family protein